MSRTPVSATVPLKIAESANNTTITVEFGECFIFQSDDTSPAIPPDDDIHYANKGDVILSYARNLFALSKNPDSLAELAISFKARSV